MVTGDFVLDLFKRHSVAAKAAGMSSALEPLGEKNWVIYTRKIDESGQVVQQDAHVIVMEPLAAEGAAATLEN